MIHTMNLNPCPFELIASGEKTFELRLYDEKRRMISVGDELRFIHTEDRKRALACKVVALHCFSSFEELYDSLPLLKCGYTEENISAASASDMNQYYSLEQQNKYGVLAIELELI